MESQLAFLDVTRCVGIIWSISFWLYQLWLGPSTLELIYANLGGSSSAPNNSVASGAGICQTFLRMSFDNQMLAALIGGGRFWWSALLHQ